MCTDLTHGSGVSNEQYTVANIYLSKVNNGNTRTMSEICSNLTLETTEQHLAAF